MNLLQNVHDVLKQHQEDFICRGQYAYYHYLCDGIDDRGWGCGYRTLQTLCSWVQLNLTPLNDGASGTVPTIAEIQDALVAMNDKPSFFKGSKQWIGSFEVPCKIIHVTKGSNIREHLEELKEHFQSFGSPIMMGGETDNSSKGIMGVRLNDPALLVIDPHCSEKATSSRHLQELGYVKWLPVDDLHMDSFYNLCLPRCKSKS